MMDIPKELQGQPWSDILWEDVQQYGQYIDQYIPLSQSPIIIDIGGNIGAAALLFHKRYHAKVITVEAIAQTYTALKRNCGAISSITPIHKAIGKEEGVISLYRYPLAPGLGGLEASRTHIFFVLCREVWANIPRTHIKNCIFFPLRFIGFLLWIMFAFCIVISRRKQTVTQTTISSLIVQHLPKTKIDILKIDIEGHELNAIKGIIQEHWTNINAMIVEVHPQNKQELLRILETHHFHICAQEKALIKGDRVPEVLVAKRESKSQ